MTSNNTVQMGMITSIANLVDGAWQALDASVSSASMGRSQGADGGNL